MTLTFGAWDKPGISGAAIGEVDIVFSMVIGVRIGGKMDVVVFPH
jgi:hypothetical protein